MEGFVIGALAFVSFAGLIIYSNSRNEKKLNSSLEEAEKSGCSDQVSKAKADIESYKVRQAGIKPHSVKPNGGMSFPVYLNNVINNKH